MAIVLLSPTRKIRSKTDKFPTINHCVIEISDIPESYLKNNDLLTFLDFLCKSNDLHIVEKFHHVFEPHGFSVVYILEESHMALHSWPNKGYLHIDLVTCSLNETNLDSINYFIKAYFNNENINIEMIKLIY